MKKLLFLSILVCFLGINHFAAITVTSPSANEVIKSAEDFAAEVFQDPMDMNEQTDLGWFIYDVLSGSKSNLSNISFSNGIFSASAVSPGPEIQILETGVTSTCFLGKIGKNFKINADKYTILAYRMYLSTSHDGLLFWSKNTIYNDITRTNAFPMKNGWRIGFLVIPELGSAKVLGTKYPWTGSIDSFRIDPVPVAVNVKVDWFRLVQNRSGLYRTVRWSGSTGNVDIYLDTDKNAGNGTLGRVAADVSGTSYQLYVGGLEPGVYYVGIKHTSGGTLVYGNGYYRVNDIPTLKFINPSEEGGNDFATMELGNAWDMNATSDLDGYANLTGAPTITTISAVNRQGDSLGNISVLKGTSKSGNTDPILYLLWFDGGRGAATKIDSNKYRILVLKMGLPGNWDLVGGSVARIYWHVQGEFNGSIEKMNQSADVIVRHKSGSAITIDTIIADMKTLTLENSQSTTGWNGNIDGFRVDPHEFKTNKSFYIREVKLAAFERADDSYTIKWNYTDTYATAASLSLYYDTNNSGYNGTLIKSGINPASEQYTWNTANMSAGTYYIYATFSDGLNNNRTYARWPIVIDHTVAAPPTIALSKSSLDFGTSSTSRTFAISNSGGGTLNWSVTDNRGWISVSPTSGQDSGTVTVTVSRAGKSAGTYTGTITVSDPDATNSPRTVSVRMEVSGGSSGNPKIKLNRSNLYFGASGGKITSPQTISVSNSGTGTLNWSASDNNKGWIGLSPKSGTNSGVITVTTGSSGLSPGTYTGTVTVQDPNASNSPQTVKITLKVYKSGTTDKPFGDFATPIHGSTVRSSIPVTGWVLDDIEVVSLKIYSGSTYIGEGIFVEGPRPDVEKAYPTYPKSYEAGWGYMLLTNFLPNGGNGKYNIIAKATDAEGHTVTLGSKTITVDNANAVKPFGAIDTPAQGGTAKGSGFTNWGWVLTPQPSKIPTNGSTIKVYVDGVNLGNPAYNMYRVDIATLFPGYANSNGAIGKFILDTTTYENGIHTIQWIATDNKGHTDGIGSRYFTIQNTGSSSAQNKAAAANRQIPHPTSIYELSSTPIDTTAGVKVKKGFNRNLEANEVSPDDNGNNTIEIEELERVVIRVGEQPGLYSGYLLADEELKPLPPGSTFDGLNGVFYWGPGPGFLGNYEFVFFDRWNNRQKRVTINILPRYSLDPLPDS
ncbi:MAG: hypothetical protein PVH61_40635 [Candidatus Aminicenantes bacterium]|jgi:hypothetical protein